jgi:Glyoxalase-like domain
VTGARGGMGYDLVGTAAPSVLGAAMAGSRLYGGSIASVKRFQVTFDCAEPERVARFWCEVLGYVVPPPPEGFARAPALFIGPLCDKSERAGGVSTDAP